MAKNTKPFFSIIIPTFNRAADLRFTLFCLLRQSFENYEIIVSDNCSTDNTRQMILALKHKKILYYRNNSNIGYAPNVKKGLAHASGKYVFLHGDDDFLVDKDTLFQIYRTIGRLKPGFVRVNYVCRSSNKKYVFNFPPNKKFTRNMYLPKGALNRKVLAFVTDSEPNFLTGILLKNALLSKTEFLYSEVCPWIDMLLYSSRHSGAYFISKPYIVASWSQRHKDTHSQRVFYDLLHGKIQSESYLHIVKKYLNLEEYHNFLYTYLNDAFVNMFPAIKFYTGNNNLYNTYCRIKVLKPDLANNIRTKALLYISLLLPNVFWGLLRNYYLFKYMKFTNVKTSTFEAALQSLYREYSHENVKNL